MNNIQVPNWLFAPMITLGYAFRNTYLITVLEQIFTEEFTPGGGKERNVPLGVEYRMGASSPLLSVPLMMEGFLDVLTGALKRYDAMGNSAQVLSDTVSRIVKSSPEYAGIDLTEAYAVEVHSEYHLSGSPKIPYRGKLLVPPSIRKIRLNMHMVDNCRDILEGRSKRFTVFTTDVRILTKDGDPITSIPLALVEVVGYPVSGGEGVCYSQGSGTMTMGQRNPDMYSPVYPGAPSYHVTSIDPETIRNYFRGYEQYCAEYTGKGYDRVEQSSLSVPGALEYFLSLMQSEDFILFSDWLASSARPPKWAEEEGMDDEFLKRIMTAIHDAMQDSLKHDDFYDDPEDTDLLSPLTDEEFDDVMRAMDDAGLFDDDDDYDDTFREIDDLGLFDDYDGEDFDDDFDDWANNPDGDDE